MEIKRTDKPPQIIKPEETKQTEEPKTKAASPQTSDSFEQSKSKLAPEYAGPAPEPGKKPGQITGGILTKGLLQARLGEPGIKAEGPSKIAIKKTDVRSIATSSERQEQINHIRSLIGEINQEFRSPQKVSLANSEKQIQFTEEGVKFRETQAAAEAAAERQRIIDEILNNPTPVPNPLGGLDEALDNASQSPSSEGDKIQRKIVSDSSEKQAEFTEDIFNFRNPQKPVANSSERQEQINHIRSLITEVAQEFRPPQVTSSANSEKQTQFTEQAAKFRDAQAAANAAAERQAFINELFNNPTPLHIPLLEELGNASQSPSSEGQETSDNSNIQRFPTPDINRIQKLLTELLASAKKLRSSE